MSLRCKLATLIGLILIGLGLIVFWPSRAQTHVEINGVRFNVQIADTEQARERGLSGQKGLGEHEGMLFVFEKPDRYPFWMQGMLFPIDIIYIRDGAITEIAADLLPPKPGSAAAKYSPQLAADHVLEVRAGTAQGMGWKNGTRIDFSPNSP